jgi:hypothetical protein
MNYSDEDPQRIIAESRSILERPDLSQEREAERREEPPVTSVDLPPLETRNEKHRRELAEQERRFAAERRRDHRLDTRQLSVADVNTLIAAALCEERAVVIPVIRQALDELLDQERKHHRSQLLERTRGLELAVAKLESTLAQLQLALATERKSIIDLPNPLRH